MKRRSEIKLFALAFLSASLALFSLLELGVIERVSFAMEKGRLRAAREGLSSNDRSAYGALTGRMVARLATPAVVSIETELPPVPVTELSEETLDAGRKPPAPSPSLDRDRPEALSDPVQGSEDPNDSSEAPPPRQGLGSGFVFDADRGYILTNAHVVSGARRVRVYLADGRETEGEILGVDPDTDLAVLRIALPRLHGLPLSETDDTQVGDEVFAVGNPFGLQGSVTKGIVSAVDRRNVRISGSRYGAMLQTDAVITPGSSGGPLVNARGEVIGVNTAMATSSGRYDGVGFAVPAARVREIVGELVEGGPGFLGVIVGTVTNPIWRPTVAELGWTEPYGALVTEVLSGLAAEQAGLRPDDIIVAVNGVAVKTNEQLADAVAETEPGTHVELGIWRDRQEVTLRVRVSRRYAPR